MPELEPELRHVINAFDPWARDRGEYYSLEWKREQTQRAIRHLRSDAARSARKI